MHAPLLCDNVLGSHDILGQVRLALLIQAAIVVDLPHGFLRQQRPYCQLDNISLRSGVHTVVDAWESWTCRTPLQS